MDSPSLCLPVARRVAGMKGSTVCALHNPGWEEEPAVQSDWGDQNLRSPSLGVQRRGYECCVGYPERLPRGGDGTGWKDLGRENIQASAKCSNNSNPEGFLGGLNELLLRNACLERAQHMGLLPSTPVT